jgi:hypothetical protein
MISYLLTNVQILGLISLAEALLSRTCFPMPLNAIDGKYTSIISQL